MGWSASSHRRRAVRRLLTLTLAAFEAADGASSPRFLDEALRAPEAPRRGLRPIAAGPRDRSVPREAGRGARSRIERPLVDAEIKNRWVLLEGVLRAVAVVDVPVDDQDALAPALGLEPPREDRDVVEQAETERERTLGVVSGRPDEPETV